jgi:hypothetical protein
MEMGELLKAAFPELESSDPVAAFGQLGDIFQALAYAWLYWPKMLEIHGAVFLAFDGDDEAQIKRRLTTPYGDEHPDWPAMPWTDAVDSYNRFEIEHLFRVWRGPAELVGEAARVLGVVLMQTWRHRLADAFPGREFSVLLESADDGGLWIQVRQLRPDLTSPCGWDAKRRFVSPA